jgi:hypothetical protein
MNVAIPWTKEINSAPRDASNPAQGCHLQPRPSIASVRIPTHAYNLSQKRNTLLCLGKANGAVADVVDRVPPPEEGVTENGERTNGLREVHSHECRDARALNLEDVVVSTDGEVVASERKGKVGQTIHLVALNRVLSVERLLCADFLVQELGNGGGQSDQRGTGVQDDTSVVHLGSLVTEGDRIEVNLPVSLAPQGKLGELAGVVVLVHATKGCLGLAAVVGVSKVEGEDGFVQQALVQHVVDRRDDLVDTDGIVSQAHDAIESAKGKSEARLRSGLSKVLILDLQVADLEGVPGHEAT